MISTDCTDSKSNYCTTRPWRLLICLRNVWRYDKGYLEVVNWRTDITMAKRYDKGYLEVLNWRTDITMAKRYDKGYLEVVNWRTDIAMAKRYHKGYLEVVNWRTDITAGAVGRQSALHKENSGFAAPTLGRHISTFRCFQILFSIRNPYINRFTNHFSIHSVTRLQRTAEEFRTIHVRDCQ